jgi:hydrogenase expression/formation protein HypC
MCLAIPMRVVSIEGSYAIVDAEGVTRRVRTDVLDDLAVGEYVLVHAGIAIAKVKEDEAQATLSLVRGIFEK